MRVQPSSRRWVRGAVAAAFAFGVATWSAPAAADHQGNGTSIENRDNNEQDVEHYNLTNAGDYACNHGDAQLERSEITTSSGTTDIHCHDGDYGDSGWIGQTYCQSMNWTLNRCDHYNVTFNYWYNGGTNPDTTTEFNVWKSTGCHEFGHTSSIGHITSLYDSDNISCMRSSASASRTIFITHDLNAIDADCC